jgi:hypothetical protein
LTWFHSRKQRRKSGIPTGNAGEYFVMAELLRRGYDGQLADRNTKGYDILVGGPSDQQLRKVQVKTVRALPWYVNVLLGPPDVTAPVRYFITPNAAVASGLHVPGNGKWNENGFMALKSLLPYENAWERIFDHDTKA